MCTASQGDPPVKLSWVKDAAVLEADGDPVQGGQQPAGIQIKDFAAFSSVLAINSVTSNHSGNYTCVVTNRAGRAEFTAALSVTGNSSSQRHLHSVCPRPRPQ